jgi:DNA repair protein NreA
MGLSRPTFGHPGLTVLRARRLGRPGMLAVADVGKLFDDDTRTAIASGLCVRCRAAKLLCGKPRCPILVQYDSMMRTKPLIDDTALDGSSPPGVFVGRFGYPKVFVGPLIPPVHGDTEVLDTPEAWIGRTLDEIVGFRSQLVRGMHRTHVLDVEGGGRVVDRTRELALSNAATDVEAEFARKPRGRLVLDEDVQPFGPSAPIERFDLGGYRVDPKLDRAFQDADLRAKPAVLDLYRDGVPVSKIQRAFSVGAFGLGKNRRFVPTRWSITAVDDTIGKDLRERVRRYPVINEVRVYESQGFDDRFLVVLLPRPWRYELIEAWYPNTLWNPLGREVVMFGDHEGAEGRTEYASIGGCYYAARLAVGEALERERRQAAAVILRETHPGYLMPVGVWNVREHVREALRGPPRRFATPLEALGHLATRLDIPMDRWVRTSEVLRHVLHQRALEDFGGSG